MILILDSHALVLAATAPFRLSRGAARAIVDRTNRVFVSVVTAYELEFKRPRDPLLSALPANLDEAVTGQSFEWLALTAAQAALAGRLPRRHGDPFDRLIIAQAFELGAAVVGADKAFPPYGVPMIW